MIDFNLLLQNPELAKSVKLEISGSDLVSLASALVKATRETTLLNAKGTEQYITTEEACRQVRRDKTTLFRWHKTHILEHNSLGLYKQSDITNFLNR